MLFVLSSTFALDRPVTGMDSNFFENFSMAITPQALAMVVCHAPRRCLPMAPRTRRGMSSFQRSRSRNVRTERTEFTSPDIMSHQR